MLKKILNVPDSNRVFFVGDLHGEITKLNEKLVEVGFDDLLPFMEKNNETK